MILMRIRGRARFAWRNDHDAWLFDKGPVEINRARCAEPRLDTKEGRARLHPKAQFAKALPGKFEARTRWRGEANPSADDLIHDDCIRGEQILP